MRRSLFLAVCLSLVFFGPTRSHAQNSPRERLRAQATEMSASFRTKQYDKIIDMMYPKVVEAAGGHDQMLNILKNGMNEMANSGLKFDAVEIGQVPEPVAGGTQLFAIVPQNVRMSGPKVKIESAAYLLAISDDQGKTWTFLDGAGLTPAAISQLFPNFPAALKLPAKQQPKITRQP